MPYQSEPTARGKINSGEMDYVDVHLSHVAQQVWQGHYGDVDVAVVEVAAITEDCQRVDQELPQAMRRALPPLGNQFIIGLKDSSLAAFISVNELFNIATTQGSNSFDNMTYLLVVAVYYLVLVLLLTFAVQTVEKKLSVSDH